MTRKVYMRLSEITVLATRSGVSLAICTPSNCTRYPAMSLSFTADHVTLIVQRSVRLAAAEIDAGAAGGTIVTDASAVSDSMPETRIVETPNVYVPTSGTVQTAERSFV